ncbi:MAG: lysylphosphatidylglycerol synthase domain-containing protein, partial [Planctomycetota bacterium]
PISHTAPIVVAERFTDLLGFLLLVALAGLATAPEQAWIFWSTLGLCAALLVGVGSVRLGELACSLLARLPLVGGLAPRVRTALASTRVLLAPRELVLPTLLATLGWGLECTGFWLVADSLVEADLPFLFAVYTFALSAVAGAVLILFPGGLGPTEATMTGLLSARYRALGVAQGAAAAKAVTATVVIRLCTLWFAMGIGMLALSIFGRRHGQLGTQSQ